MADLLSRCLSSFSKLYRSVVRALNGALDIHVDKRVLVLHHFLPSYCADLSSAEYLATEQKMALHTVAIVPMSDSGGGSLRISSNKWGEKKFVRFLALVGRFSGASDSAQPAKLGEKVRSNDKPFVGE